MASGQESSISSLSAHLEALRVHGTAFVDSRPVVFTPPATFTPTMEIPRYLFRVFSNDSAGFTDASWARSVSVALGHNVTPSNQCIFTRSDRDAAATMLYKHLDWKAAPMTTNLVSWTSSMLYAVILIFNQRAYHNQKFEDISLCIIDTTQFSEATFMGDLDLIREFKPHNGELSKFEGMRNRRNRSPKGFYYFGEYFSQGALKIEGRCKIVNAWQLLDAGLLSLDPSFPEFSKWEAGTTILADAVMQLRRPFYGEQEDATETHSQDRIQCCAKIGNLFGPVWRIPIALSILSLVPVRNRSKAVGVLNTFSNEAVPWFWEITECSALGAKIVTNEKLPEVNEFEKNWRAAYADFCIAKLRHNLQATERNLARAREYAAMLNKDQVEDGGENQVAFWLDDILQEMTAIESQALSLYETQASGAIEE